MKHFIKKYGTVEKLSILLYNIKKTVIKIVFEWRNQRFCFCRLTSVYSNAVYIFLSQR